MSLFKFKKKHSKEWIQEALAEIDKLDPAKRIPSSENVCFSLEVDLTVTDYEKWKSKLEYPTFQELLLHCIESKGLKYPEFYKAAYLDRKLFSAIKNDRHYQPKKETAVACCFALGLNLIDAKDLLGTAGYSLSLSIAWDRVVYYCLDKGITDIYSVNELLDAVGEKCIRE